MFNRSLYLSSMCSLPPDCHPSEVAEGVSGPSRLPQSRSLNGLSSLYIRHCTSHKQNRFAFPLPSFRERLSSSAHRSLPLLVVVAVVGTSFSRLISSSSLSTSRYLPSTRPSVPYFLVEAVPRLSELSPKCSRFPLVLLVSLSSRR